MPQLKQQCLAQLASADVALHHSSLVLQLSRQLRLPELAGLEARALQELRGRLAAEVTGDSLCQVGGCCGLEGVQGGSAAGT
jgi:hypothetical protein